MKIYEIIFSPTGGTQNVADVFAAAFDQEVELVDLTDYAYDFSALEIEKEDICIIAAPAYGGRVPAVAASRLAQIKGNGAKAVLIAVYGNREFDDTLVELQDIAVAGGFTPIAGVGAVAEHSLVRQFGANRPDEQDLSELQGFAAQIVELTKSDVTKALELPGNYPYKTFNGVPAKPVVNENCGGCAICAWNCPVEAISEEHPEQTNYDLCISCMRCVSICPNQARALTPEMTAAFTQKLAPVCSERKSNILYI